MGKENLQKGSTGETEPCPSSPLPSQGGIVSRKETLHLLHPKWRENTIYLENYPSSRQREETKSYNPSTVTRMNQSPQKHPTRSDFWYFYTV